MLRTVPLGERGRVLVVKLRHHGDVLLAAPVLTTLKSHAPAFEIDALIYDDTAPMLEGHPALSELHLVGRNWKALGMLDRFSREMELFGRLRARRYDLLVHLSEQPRGAWLARTLGARYAVAPAMPGRGRFWAKSFTHLYPVVGGGRRHQVELNLDALRRIGIQPSLADRKVVFVPGKQAEAKVSPLVPESFIHMHPAPRWIWSRRSLPWRGRRRSASPARSPSRSSARSPRARACSSASIRCRCISRRRWARRASRCSGRAARTSGARGTSSGAS